MILRKISNLTGKLTKKPLSSLLARAILHRSRSVEDFWEVSHFFKSSRWITGSSPEDELRNLRFYEIKESVDTILIVGVGSGDTANYLCNKGFKVSVLDISESALRKVDKRIMKYLVSEYDKIPKARFDVVLHHLVAQHMTTKDLIEQLQIIFNALKDGGEIRMQIASSMKSEKNDLDETLINVKMGSVLRSENKIRKLVSSITSNYTIRHLSDFPNWEEGWKWYLVVVKK